jgi:hypothetical protein
VNIILTISKEGGRLALASTAIVMANAALLTHHKLFNNPTVLSKKFSVILEKVDIKH